MSDINQPTVAQSHEDDKADEAEPDVHFEPVVKLEKVEFTDSEANETPIFKMRAKLFRFDKSGTEWKERGTGEMKLLMHKTSGKVRVLMRREKTLKLCANHYITPEMKLNPNIGSDRSWVWTALADYSEEEVKPEMLAARFATSDVALRFKAKFEEAQKWNQSLNNGTCTPNSGDAPKPDRDAVETQPEEGSDKKKKEEEAAAATAVTITSAVEEEVKTVPVVVNPATEVQEVKPVESAPEIYEKATEEKHAEKTTAVDQVVDTPPSEDKLPEVIASEPASDVAESNDKPQVVGSTVEDVTESLAAHTIDAPTKEEAVEQTTLEST